MTALREAAQQALEALEAGLDVDPILAGEAEEALRAALAQEKPEPLNLSDRAVQRRLAAQWGYVPAALADEAAAELRRLRAENERLAAALASSCDEQRHELWESGGVAGCERARVAERQRDALLAEHQQTLALQQRSYEREIQLEVEAEREACAKLCEHYDDDRGTGETWGPRFAAIIRARTT